MERKIDRFDKYIKIKGINDNRVTIDLGISVGTLGKSRKSGRDLSTKNIELILNYYTDINRLWLLTGEGEMLKGNVEPSQERETITIDKEAWEVIRLQAKSLDRKDAQVDELIQIIKDKEKMRDKDALDAGCAVAKASSDE